MFLYNVTVSLDPQVEKEWLEYMKETHIREVLATNCFIECKLSRVHGEEEQGVTYSVMYLLPSEDKYNEYQSKFAKELQKDHVARFNGKFASFRTTLTVIDHFSHEAS